MVSTSKNSSAIQSRNWIMKSLVDLMEKKDYNDISISEIALNAGLVRRTFYRHFSSKEDVLQAYLDTLVEEFKEKLSSETEIDCTVALRKLFAICKDNKNFFLGLKRSNMLLTLLGQWNVILPIIHTQMLDKIKHFPQTKSPEALEYLLAFNAGGTFNMIIKWIDSGMEMSPDELANIVEEFSRGSLIANDYM